MKFIRSMQADRLITQLVAVRDHEDADAKKAIARLSGLGPAAVPKVIEALADADRNQTVTFVEILSDLLDERSLPYYMSALSHENRRVLSGVAWALTSNKKYNPNKLLDLLEDPDVPKHTLIEVLSAHKDRLNIRALLTHAYSLPPNEKAACMRIVQEVATEDMIPELIGRLTGKDPVVRVHIIGILSRFNKPEVQKALQNQLRDKSKLVRQAALTSLANMGGRIDIELLCELLKDPEIDVQNKAVDVVVRIRHPDTMKYLVDVLKDESEYSRRAAVEVLNEIGDTKSIQDLLNALKDDDWWVRSRATDALAKIGGPRVVDAVLELVKSKDEGIRRSAIEILNTTKDERAVDHLLEATKDPDWWVRERAADALAEIGDERAVPALTAMLDGPPQSIPAVIRALSTIGDRRAVDALMPMLDRQEREIQVEAVQALAKLADQSHAHEVMRRLGAGTIKTDLGEVAEEALRDLNDRFSATAIAANEKAERMAEPARTMLVERPEEVEAVQQAAKTTATLDLSALEVGDIIENRYQFIQQIGKGAFGTVILVEDKVVDERLVLKFLNKNIAADEEMLKRFVHELRYSRKITHKNVIRIYDFLNLGGLYAISMEYFPSHTLSGEIKGGKPLAAPDAMRIAHDVATGMSVAHQVGIVHRDLKPANVLINNDGLVKVVDFGVAAAHSSGDTQLTKTGYVIGSPKYMAPEQILGKKVDQRADIYSLGVILYELLAGKPPYTEGDHMSVMYQHVQGNARPVCEANPRVPTDVGAVVSRAMAVDKLERYQTMEEFRKGMEACHS